MPNITPTTAAPVAAATKVQGDSPAQPSTYIMTSDMFSSLCQQVNGFCESNGSTYQEHILEIFNEQLSPDQKNLVQNSATTNDALQWLNNFGIAFHHNM